MEQQNLEPQPQNNSKTLLIIIAVLIILLITITTFSFWQISNLRSQTEEERTELIRLREGVEELKEVEEVVEEEIKRVNGKAIINDDIIKFSKQECGIYAPTGVPVEDNYGLEIKFIDEKKERFNYIIFRVQGSRDELLSIGAHVAGGRHSDIYANRLEQHTFSFLLENDEMEIVLEELELIDNKASMSGYVNIKKLISRDCPETMHVEGQTVRRGDPEYYCDEDFYLSNYLKPQNIYFECFDGVVYR